MTARARRLLSLTRLCALLACTPACLFCPDLESAGYTPCDADGDCPAGRYCEQSLCTPPPWNDEAFGTRRHLAVKNESDRALPEGAAIPVEVGDDGVLSREDVGVDGRFTAFDRKKGRWRVVPIFRDIESDRYTAWIPLPQELGAGKTATLAWLEADSEDGEPTQLEDAAGTFDAYASFSDGTLDGWFESSTGGDPPLVNDGVANIADNQALVLQTPIAPPAMVTFVARVNGNTCDEVFIGLVGDNESIFNDAPSAGLFVRADLDSTFDIAPTPDSFPEPVGETLRAPNTFSRVVVHVDRARASLRVGDVVTGEDDVRPPFGDAPMYAAVQVGGNCSVDLDAVWAAPLPAPAPSVTVGPAIQLKLRF